MIHRIPTIPFTARAINCFTPCLVLAMVIGVGLSTKTARAAKEDAIAARDKALAEEDRKAFAENMRLYERVVQPFLDQHCVSCHGPKKLEGDLALDLLDADMKESTSGARWAVVRDKLESGEMPPDDRPRPASKEVDKVLAWIKAEMKRARRNFSRRQQYVQGNKVPHAMLFDSRQSAPLDVPPRLRRKSHEIYETFRRSQPENAVGNPFTPDPRFVFRDMGAPQLDLPTTSQLLRNALTVIKRQTAHAVEGGKLKGKPGSKKEWLEFFDPGKPLDEEQMAKAVTRQFQQLLSRTPTEEELSRFVALMRKNVGEAGRVAGVQYTLAAVYLLPEAIFRYEIGGEVNDQGKTRLTPRETAFALAYALTDQQPSDWLLKDAEEGRLEDPDAITAAVQRMFADEKLAKPRILRFFHEYFEYPKAIEVFKNPEDFKYHKARVLVSDTDNLVRWILERDRNVLHELLTTDKSYVNTRFDSNKKRIVQYERNGQVHRSYSLPPDWKWTSQQPITIPNKTRAGILTQPSWLVAWSVNQDNHAILRGKWVRERLLGNVVPDIPITVDAQLPDAPEKTLRERMAVTREQYCWQCHKLMNPVGLPFERFDHFGRWRALELAKPVDATGRIDLTGDDFEADVADAVEFVHQLAGSERVEQVFVRHVFRYFAGRNENLGDGPSLRAAQAAYRESGGSFKALVAAVFSSDSFLMRTPDSVAHAKKRNE